MNHFDEITCILYLDGQLDANRAAELVAHARSCAACGGLLAALERESRLLQEAMGEEEEAVPARVLERPAREPVSWAWIIGFGLAAAGTYTIWTGIVDPLRQQLSQAGFGEANLLTMLFFSGAFWQGWTTMKNFIEIAALTTLGVALLALLGRYWRRWTTVGIMLAALLAVLLSPGAARAAEIRKGKPDYSLSAGQVVKHDLLVHANSVQIDGDVEGDLFVFAHHVEINGRIRGDVIGLTYELRITGRVDGNVRDASHSFYLDGSVEKSITAWVGQARITPKAQVGGSLMVGTKDLQLNGRVARDLMTFAADETIDGFVGGDARLRGGRLRIGPDAAIQGQAIFRGETQPDVSPQAKLASPLEVKIVKHRPDYLSPHAYMQLALLWGVAFLFGVLIAVLMPGFFADVVRSCQRYGVSLGVGAITLVGGVVLAVIAALLLFVGLAGGAIVLLLFAPALYSAQVFVGTWLGEKLLGPPSGTGSVLGRLALGLLVIRLVWHVPYLGWVLWCAVNLWGLGALTLTLYKIARPQVATAA